MYESKATARSEFAQFRQMFLLVGGILCAIIGLVGLLRQHRINTEIRIIQ